jgi:ferredoxin
VMHAPKLFDQDEETGLVIVLQPEVLGEDLEAALLAERSCPVRAVTLSG